MKIDLKGKVALVTGAARGIGRAVAETLSESGSDVVIADLVKDGAESAAQEVKETYHNRTLPAYIDVSKFDSVEECVKNVIESFGKIDILVNNAGVNFVKAFEQMETSDWDRVINTDLRGTFMCSRYAIDHMLKAKKGSIINIGTVHSMQSMPGAGPYDAAKWGMVGLTKSMAVEFASRNIRVNVLSPGHIDTQIWTDIKNAAPDLDKCLSFWKSNIPAGRVGTPEEVAFTAVFLASDEASYVTGANLLVDGGMTSQLISMEPYESENLEGGKR